MLIGWAIKALFYDYQRWSTYTNTLELPAHPSRFCRTIYPFSDRLVPHPCFVGQSVTKLRSRNNGSVTVTRFHVTWTVTKSVTQSHVVRIITKQAYHVLQQGFQSGPIMRYCDVGMTWTRHHSIATHVFLCRSQTISFTKKINNSETSLKFTANTIHQYSQLRCILNQTRSSIAK